MVMRRNAMRKNLLQSIRKSFGRYIAIVAIIALGSAMFVGLLMTKTDMVATGQVYMDEQNMFDLRLMNAYGWTQEHVDAAKEIPGLQAVEGIRYADLIVRLNESEDDLVYRFYAMPETLNQFSLRGGRLPQAPNECLTDGYHANDSILGTTITISDTNDEENAEVVTEKTFTVVGYVANPLYMDMNRGTTSVGNGSLANYVIVPSESLDIDYFAEIHATIPGQYDVYSQAYNDAMEAAGESAKPYLQGYADDRLADIREEALEAYEDGEKQYEKGLQEFLEGKETALKELEEGYQKLVDAEAELEKNRQSLAYAEVQIANAWQQIFDGEAQLAEGKAQLEQTKQQLLGPLIASEAALREKYEPLTAEYNRLDAQVKALEAEISELKATIAAKSTRLEQLKDQIPSNAARMGWLETQIWSSQMLRNTLALAPTLNALLIAELDQSIAAMTAELEALRAQQPGLIAERDALEVELAEPKLQIKALEDQLSPIKVQRDLAKMSVDTVYPTYQAAKLALQEMEKLFASSEAEIKAAEQQLIDGRNQLYYQQSVIAHGKVALEEGALQIQQGWLDYEEGKLKAEEELAKAQQDLDDARIELDDAWEMIQGMTENEVIVLNRTSNVGYNSLESASDIVQGVSRVLPAFFLLVASLVCITTMTRMIDEERTQIGTLKALGYSNRAIISKYMIYAGSGAVLGCGLGVLAGSAVMPMTLWQAYKIMLYITDDLVLKVDWLLCGAVVGTYTAVMLSVTWYCCRKALKEVPAELIRPKAPDAGKKIFMEYLPFWDKIGFLNKVTIRNIFRYRQRLAMMMVGIGGCTALLVTGFGLRDSIVNVVDYQFREVTTYDMSVYFRDHQTEEEQAEFKKKVAGKAQDTLFYHQSSVDIDFDGMTKEIYLIAAEDGITRFIDLHKNDDPIPTPGLNEVVLSVGVAEAMGISVGDTVSMRNADMQVLEVTVSGIYDNHVENYAIVSPGSLRNQWGEPPALQMAFVKAAEGQDIHQVSADITDLHDVMNVSVSEDLADMVGGMMDALDLVVWVIVFCAGALAVIVLYNLTNININERIREIATIKVLGFNAKETAMYVFKENLSLTVIGSVFGIGLGYLMLLFVMSQIRIDMVWFKALVMPRSYVISLALTFLSACLVDFMFYFKLDKINMAEALKSVE